MALPIEGELSVGLRGSPLIVISLNCLIAVGTYRYNLDGAFQLLFEERDVVVELLGEFLLRGHFGHVALPTGKFSIDGLDFALDRVGELLGLYAIDAVGYTGLDSLKGIEHVALHHDEVCHTIDHDRIFQRYEVNPTTATLTTSNRTELVSEGAELVAYLVEHFGREGTDT